MKYIVGLVLLTITLLLVKGLYKSPANNPNNAEYEEQDKKINKLIADNRIVKKNRRIDPSRLSSKSSEEKLLDTLYFLQNLNSRFQDLNIDDLRELEELDLNQLTITSDGLKSLSSLPSLSSLKLEHSRIRPEALKDLFSLTSLTKLNLNNLNLFTDDDLEKDRVIRKKREEREEKTQIILAIKDVEHGRKLTDEDMIGLSNLNSLESLVLTSANITSQSLIELADLVLLTHLSLACTDISSINGLSNLTSLTSLSLRYTQVNDQGLKTLAEFVSLKSLVLSGTKITKRKFKSILKLKHISELSARDMNF